MAFHPPPEETLRDGLQRYAAGQYDDAIARLAGPAGERQAAIHETRKSLKRLRALLRLLRPSLGVRYQAENARLREIAARLAPYRDADAMLELLEVLHKTQPELLDQRMYTQAHAVLQGRRDTQLLAGDGYPAEAGDVIERLRDARLAMAGWPLPETLHSIEKALRDSYRRARKAAKQAISAGGTDDYHSWRKRVKALLYQCELFKGTSLALPAPHRKKLARLAELLGEHHDLSVFEQLLASPGIFTDRTHAGQVLALARQRRHKLERRAAKWSADLFSAKPKNLFGTR
jgi:CHAD domain-containing protein